MQRIDVSPNFLFKAEQNCLFQKLCFLHFQIEQQVERLGQIEKFYLEKALDTLRPEEELENEKSAIKPIPEVLAEALSSSLLIILVNTNFLRLEGRNREELKIGLVALYREIIGQVSVGNVRIWHRRTHYQKLRRELAPNQEIVQREPRLKTY